MRAAAKTGFMPDQPPPPSPAEAQQRADEEQWRREVASRVEQHRVRRRRRVNPNASFEFDFPAASALAIAPTLPQQTPMVDQVDEHILAGPGIHLPVEAPLPRAPRKIIRFPKHVEWETADFVDKLEQAEPPHESPRIMEAAEPQQLELLPAFPDLHLDEEPPKISMQQLDLPPQPAPPAERIFSAIVDAALLAIGEAIFLVAFLQISGPMTVRQTAPWAVCSLLVFWCLFQYVFLVYGTATPGMRAAGVELCTFAGLPASVRARKRRAFAATLSALSVGLGFLWALVDEDTLGWHDRISETYLRSGDRGRSYFSPPQ